MRRRRSDWTAEDEARMDHLMREVLAAPERFPEATVIWAQTRFELAGRRALAPPRPRGVRNSGEDSRRPSAEQRSRAPR